MVDVVFNTSCYVPAAERLAHIQAAVGLGLPQFSPAEESKDVPLAVCGTAPSINGFLDELRTWPGDILAANGALNYLIERGIAPKMWMGIDPHQGLAEYLTSAPAGVTYYVGSWCHPDVFAALRERDVVVYHSLSSEVPHPPSQIAIGGGNTCLSRAPTLGYLLGYDEIHVFGCDGNWIDAGDGRTGTAAGPGWGHILPTTLRRVVDGEVVETHDVTTQKVELEGVTYLTCTEFIEQAKAFVQIAKMFPGKLEFHGRGLTQDLVAAVRRGPPPQPSP